MSTQRQLVTQEFNFTPTTLEEAQKYATIFANSGLCPENYKGRPNDILIVWQMGAELGLKKMQALRSLGCINGMPFAYGDGLLALVKNHPEFIDMKEWFEGELENKTLTAYCTITREGKEPVTQKFSIQDAITANLWGKKGPWTQYPRRMLQHRARGFACKDAFPDAIFGIMSEEEAYSVVESKQAANTPTPKGKGMQGLEQSLGIVSEPTVIEAEEASFEVISSNEEPEIVYSTPEETPLEELKRLIRETNTSGKALNGWLKKAKVSRLEDLSIDHINQGIQFLKTKEKK